MGNINVLLPNVYNVLAAGEVIERPASVVKELVENSIDAGATQIDVLIEDGGITKICVSDDGIGIMQDDMRKAFMPHATSKLSAASDLDSLSTLGFRGEALASIASVSEVSLTSHSHKQNSASKIELKGGEVTSEGVGSREVGTQITVENLFANTPARLKFLKKPAQEQRYIEDIVGMLILANPTVKITLRTPVQTLLSSDGSSLDGAVAACYGIKTLDKMLPIRPQDGASRIKVSGFVSRPDFTRPNRAMQTAIVNGRVVKDATVQTAVERAYGDLLMRRAYPAYVIEIVMPFDEVDVNVHPSKTEVRFLDKQKVFSAVYHAVDVTLNGSQTSKNSVETPQYAPISLDTSKLFAPAKHAPVAVRYDDEDGRAYSPAFGGYSDFGRLDFAKSGAILNERPVPSYTERNYSGGFDNKMFNSNGGDGEALSYAPSSKEDDDGYVFDGKIVGQAFSTYIIVEKDDSLYVIDQHAAHERLLYDKIRAELDQTLAQPLLIPYKLRLNADEEENLQKISTQLEAMGFDIQTNDGVALIKEVPSAAADVNFTQSFGELLGDLDASGDGLTLAKLLKDKLARKACRAAIKGGEELTRSQIYAVLNHLAASDGNLPESCPHGRPAVIEISRAELEKMFKRKV